MSTFNKIMELKTDTELIEIVYLKSEDYQKEALLAAKSELELRNINKDSIKPLLEQRELISNIEAEKADKMLPTGLKILTFIFPTIITLIISAYLSIQGYKRRSKDLTKWTLYGFFLYFVLTIVFLLFFN